MKIERQEEKFRPITITLESGEEAMLLGAALSHTSVGEGVNPDILYPIYREVVREAGSPSDIFDVVRHPDGLRIDKR